MSFGTSGRGITDEALAEEMANAECDEGENSWTYLCSADRQAWTAAARIAKDRLTRLPTAAEAPASTINGEPATAHSLLAALIDILDDEQKNAPEDRCYVDSAWSDVLKKARQFLALQGATINTRYADAEASAPAAELKQPALKRIMAPDQYKRAVEAAVSTQAPATEPLVQLFNEALAFGLVYGPAIPGHQWDEMRDTKAKQLAVRAGIESPAEGKQP